MSQTLPLSQINQSTGAKRTIANMAKKMRLDPAWLHTLLSLHWNYDKVGREAMGWVTPAADADFASAIARINHAVNIKHSASPHGQPEPPIAPDAAAQAVLHALAHTDEAELQQRFAAAVQRGDTSIVQEYARYHFYRYATAERLLARWPQPLTPEAIAKQLFFKVFSAYHDCHPYVCLVLPLPYTQTSYTPSRWLDDFLAAVQHTPPPTLSDLLAALATYCTGNKEFRQEVLQALSYAGLLQVNGHPVREQYLPDCQNQYSTHFMSNEWSYPLRFWNDGQKAA